MRESVYRCHCRNDMANINPVETENVHCSDIPLPPTPLLYSMFSITIPENMGKYFTGQGLLQQQV